jgi:tRNA(Ile2) C34 agmatinyltransferase TiaS
VTELSLGAALAARRKTRTKECPVCGHRFVTKGRGLYCSPSCGQKARRQRGKPPSAAQAAHEPQDDEIQGLTPPAPFG